MLKKIAIVLVLVLINTAANAADQYVTDQFNVMLRSGESATHKIVRMLSSGTKIKVLSKNKKTGYTHVRLSNGKTGYILSRQLMNLPSARERLSKAEEQLEQLQAEPDKLASKLSKLQQEYQTLNEQHKALIIEKDAQSNDLDKLRQTSNNAVRIENERNDLRKRTTSLIKELEEVKQQNRELSNNSNQYWFMMGSVVLVAGVIIGFILPLLRFRKRKSDWGSL